VICSASGFVQQVQEDTALEISIPVGHALQALIAQPAAGVVSHRVHAQVPRPHEGDNPPVAGMDEWSTKYGAQVNGKSHGLDSPG